MSSAKKIRVRSIQLLLFVPAALQLFIYFFGKDFYPFSKNEMYAGHPDPVNYQLIYLVGIQNGKEFSNRSDFQQEILSGLIELELEKENPDFKTICQTMAKDMRPGHPMDTIRIERRSWKKISKENFLKPDSTEVMHECQYR